MNRNWIKTVLLRGVESFVAVGLALVFFLGFLFTLTLSFPQGTSLAELMLQPELGQTIERRLSFDFEESATSVPAVARLSSTRRLVKGKPSGGIAWTHAEQGMALHAHHAVQTFDRSGATISFGNNDELILGSNSLVVVRALEDGRGTRPRTASVLALEGELRGQIRASTSQPVDVEVVTPSGVAQVSSGTGDADFKITVNPDHTSTFTVTDGTAEIQSAGRTIALKANQAVTVARDRPPPEPVDLPDPPQLEFPGSGQVITFRNASPQVRLGWTGAGSGYRLVLARDAGFDEVVLDERVPDTHFVHGNLTEGRYYWRVAATRDWVEGPPSRAGLFELSRDESPPTLEVSFPDMSVTSATLLLEGRVEPGARVFIGEQGVPVDDQGEFRHALDLRRGINVVVVEAVDRAGNTTYRSQLVSRRDP